MTDRDQRETPMPSARRCRWRVVISYREPTYAQARGLEARTHTWTFQVDADDGEQAAAEARRQFENAARDATIGWVREIVRVDALLEGDGR